MKLRKSIKNTNEIDFSEIRYITSKLLVDWNIIEPNSNYRLFLPKMAVVFVPKI